MTEVEKHYGMDGPQGRSDADDGEGGRLKSAAAAAAKASGRVRDAVGGTVDQAASWSRNRYDGASGWASDTIEDASRRATYMRRKSAVHATRGWRNVEHFVDENPIMIGVVGLAAGLLAGALIPGTRRENQYFGRYADEVRDQGMRYVQDVAEQGRTLVEDNLHRIQRDRDAPPSGG